MGLTPSVCKRKGGRCAKPRAMQDRGAAGSRAAVSPSYGALLVSSAHSAESAKGTYQESRRVCILRRKDLPLKPHGRPASSCHCRVTAEPFLLYCKCQSFAPSPWLLQGKRAFASLCSPGSRSLGSCSADVISGCISKKAGRGNQNCSSNS